MESALTDPNRQALKREIRNPIRTTRGHTGQGFRDPSRAFRKKNALSTPPPAPDFAGDVRLPAGIPHDITPEEIAACTSGGGSSWMEPQQRPESTLRKFKPLKVPSLRMPLTPSRRTTHLHFRAFSGAHRVR